VDRRVRHGADPVELLRGRPALDGDDIIQLGVASRDPARRPTPRTFGVEVSDTVEAVFAKAVTVAPSERYGTMGEFWRALHQAVFPDAPTWSSGVSAGGISFRGPPTPQGPISVVVTSSSLTPREQTNATTPIVSGLMVPPESTASGARNGRARGRGLLLGGIAAITLGGLVAWGLMGRGEGPADPKATASLPLPSASAAPSAAPVVAKPTTCPDGTVLVPGGKFFMGSDDATLPLWQPAHKVILDSFCIGLHEVTAGEYKACSDVGECKRPDAVPDYPATTGTPPEQHEKNRQAYSELCTFGKPGLENHPINCVSWDKAEAYCKWKGERLPTEAEWEFAARGSDGRTFPWGDEPGDEKHMNACGLECTRWELAKGTKPSATMYPKDDGYPGTAPVGSFPAGRTKQGLDDMVGNVWEWTADWFATYKPDEVVNPTGAPAGDRKAIRGGGFNGGVSLWLNPAFRYHQLATASSHGIGFRCAKTL
jgi:formylglycine-generating enzyme required for sulfatase activity